MKDSLTRLTDSRYLAPTKVIIIRAKHESGNHRLKKIIQFTVCRREAFVKMESNDQGIIIIMKIDIWKAKFLAVREAVKALFWPAPGLIKLKREPSITPGSQLRYVSYVPSTLLLLFLLEFPGWTLRGSPGMCNCILTNAFHKGRGLRVWPFSSELFPLPHGQPRTVFRGFISISGEAGDIM